MSFFGSLVVEPGNLARVSEATFGGDPEMLRFVTRARGATDSFFVASRHGVDLVFKRAARGDLLVVPKSCRQLLLNELYSSLLAAHFGAKKTCSLLA